MPHPSEPLLTLVSSAPDLWDEVDEAAISAWLALARTLRMSATDERGSDGKDEVSSVPFMKRQIAFLGIFEHAAVDHGSEQAVTTYLAELDEAMALLTDNLNETQRGLLGPLFGVRWFLFTFDEHLELNRLDALESLSRLTSGWFEVLRIFNQEVFFASDGTTLNTDPPSALVHLGVPQSETEVPVFPDIAIDRTWLRAATLGNYRAAHLIVRYWHAASRAGSQTAG